MALTFGLQLAFFLVIIYVLHRSYRKDRSFTDYAVGGRSFGANYQAMSFLNTWYPGAMFTAFAGLAVSAGVISFYVLAYSLMTVVLMYAMSQRVWTWGQRFDLRTQPDLFALRYDSRHIRTIAALIGIVSGFPWLVLAMQAMGGLFHFMSLGALPFSEAVILSDMYQGIVAYVFGSLMLCGLVVWLWAGKGVRLQSLDPAMFSLPSFGSKEGPLYLFSLLFTSTIGGWCLPFIFVRLFTADGVAALKKSAAIAMPASLVFCIPLLIFGMLASQLPSVASHPEDVWFIVSQEAGGLLLLGLAGVVLLAASIGHTDGSIQATGAQIANDLVGNYATLSQRQLVTVSKIGMVVLTALAAWVACLKLPALFTLAVLAYQGVIQLAVPQFLGIFWKRGTKEGAIAGMVVGFVLVIVLESFFARQLEAAWGLTSGVIALAVNLAIYAGFAWLRPHGAAERQRIDGLFGLTREAVAGPVPPQASVGASARV